MTEKYVLKYHPVLENGQRSINPIQLGHLNNFKEFGSIFMYHFAKLFASRKRDFIVESKRKKHVPKNDSTLISKPRKSVVMVAKDDDLIKAGTPSVESYPPINAANYDSKAISSAIYSEGYCATESFLENDAPVQSFLANDAPVTATDTIQIDTFDEGDDEEIDETQVLNEISKL